jgi:C4-dicarboxylate-specific signal transduction histidine kinase
MQPPNLGEVREALSCVVGDTDRAGDIVDRIRDHIKKAPPRKVHFDLNEAINEVIVLGRSAIIKNRVWVQTRLSEGLLPIHGDRVQLQQVILNLLLNAVEAMGSVEAKPRELLISTEQDQDHRGVLVTVRDSGPGLDPSHLERVFDAFYTTKSSGMGCRFAGLSSTPMGGGCGQRRMNLAAPDFSSPCPPSRESGVNRFRSRAEPFQLNVRFGSKADICSAQTDFR